MHLSHLSFYLFLTQISGSIPQITQPLSLLPPHLHPLHRAKIPAAALVDFLPPTTPNLPIPSPSHSPKPVKLAYVTPWNSHGYDLAKWFAPKLTHISPVWYDLAIADDMTLSLLGAHDVDESWLAELRAAVPPPKIVPRVQLQLTQKIAEAILYFPQGQPEAIVAALLGEVEKRGYDGLTLEVPAPQMFGALISLVGDALHDVGKELVLVVPPQHTAEQAGSVFSADDLVALAGEVDYFSVMTYDHAGSLGKMGANAPLPWVQEVIEGLLGEEDEDEGEEDPDFVGLGGDGDEGKAKRSQILMGLPFYGYRYSHSEPPAAVTGESYLKMVKADDGKSLTLWDEYTKEHMTIVGWERVFYPSLLSLLWRLNLAEELGVGIAIWELGQGMDYFLDVL